MKQKKESRFIPIMLGLIAVLMSMMLLVVGCTTETQQPANTGGDTNTAPADPEPEPEPEGDDTEVEVKEVEVEKEDKESETEKQGEAMVQMIEDGQHVQQITYSTPAGQDTFEASVTTENDVVTAIELTVVEAHEVSTKYINGVNGAIGDLVIGKKINEIELPKQISGSSLTTAALQKHFDSLGA